MSDLQCTNRIIYVQILRQKCLKLKRNSMVSMTGAIRYSYFVNIVADIVVFTAAVGALVVIVDAAAAAAAVAAIVAVTVYDACVLWNSVVRYKNELIYTYSGLFCIAINPYKRFPIYTQRTMDIYIGKCLKILF